MEPRTIIVASTKNSKQYVFQSTAVTLGDLKNDLDRQGIDYTNMTFLEGKTKCEFKSNDSILPTNIPYEGTVTNDLVFLLSVVDKKIESGISTRVEAYDYIKSNKLSEDFTKAFNKNYTQGKTTELLEFCNSYNTPKPTPVKKKVIEKPVTAEIKSEKKVTNDRVIEAFVSLTTVLRNNVVITKTQADEIYNILGVDAPVFNTPESLSQSKLNEMFSFAKK